MPELAIGFTQSDRDRGYSSFCDGYRPGAAQATVTINVDFAEPLADEEWAEAVFAVTNMPATWANHLGGAQIGAALFASSGRIRSLSKGDTVTVDGRMYACASVGFKLIPDSARYADYRGCDPALVVCPQNPRHSDGDCYPAYVQGCDGGATNPFNMSFDEWHGHLSVLWPARESAALAGQLTDETSEPEATCAYAGTADAGPGGEHDHEMCRDAVAEAQAAAQPEESRNA